MRWGNKEEEPGADLQCFWVVLGAFRLPGTQRPLLPLCPLHVCHSKCGVFGFFSPVNGGLRGTRGCFTAAHCCSLLSPENVSTELTEAACRSWQEQLTVQLVSCR